MQYIVSNVDELTRLEKIINTLPKDFTEIFNTVKGHSCSPDVIYMTIKNYYNNYIDLIPSDNIDINFNYSGEDGKLNEIIIRVYYESKTLYLEYKGITSPIKSIKVKQF